jgi:putative ABC transport system substrate-binding protein
MPAKNRRSRRQFLQALVLSTGILTLLSACGTLVSPAQPARVPRIGILFRRIEAPGYAAFQQGMRELGHVEGQTFTVEFRAHEGKPELVPPLAAELLQQKVDLIYTSTTPTALAARQASSEIPIVIAATGDLVALGLVASLSHPGGNVTGVVTLAPQLSGKRLELLREAVPRMSRVGLLADAAVVDTGTEVQETRVAARTLGLSLEIAAVRGRDEIESAFATLVGADVGGLLVDETLFHRTGPDVLAELAARHRLPAIYTLREFVDQGGLLSYGANFVDAHRRGTAHIDKILKGARPADLPIEQPTTFDFVVNLKAAQALGLTIPPSVLQQATEVIQ